MVKRWLLALIVLASAHSLTAQTEAEESEPPFQAAEALSVTDIPAQNSCVVPGTVVLDVLVSDAGDAQAIEIRRNVPCFTDVAVQAVKEWKFSPAAMAGKPKASRVPVAVTFDPLIPDPGPTRLPALISQTEAAVQAEFQPAEVTRAANPPYPTSSGVVQGSVVLEVTLSAKGEEEEIQVLRDLPPFTDGAKAAAADWRFMPATFNGRPVPSKVLLAFVSQPMIVNNYP